MPDHIDFSAVNFRGTKCKVTRLSSDIYRSIRAKEVLMGKSSKVKMPKLRRMRERVAVTRNCYGLLF